jgi:tetraacyldisaccharide-1-P 4'-kinase
MTDGEPGPIPLASGQQLFRVRRRVLGFFDREGVRCEPPKRPYLLSGIARPERFAADVRTEAGMLAGHAVFPDHHAFNGSDLEQVTTQARAAAADALVTTAKDAARLPQTAMHVPILVLRIAAEFDDEAGFRQRLLDAVRSAA